MQFSQISRRLKIISAFSFFLFFENSQFSPDDQRHSIPEMEISRWTDSMLV